MLIETPVKTSGGQVPLGEALHKARKRVGFSLQAAAAAAKVTENELANYECGLRTPDAETSAALAHIYGVEPERLGNREFVARVDGRFDSDKGIIWLGWFRIDFNPVNDSNEKLFRSVGAALRSMRSLSESAPVFIRQQEVALFAGLLDLSDPDLAFLTMRYLRLSYAEASGLIERMWEHSISSTQAARVTVAIQ